MTPAELPRGASAYFSPPEQNLDPSLFTPDGTLQPGVRDYVLSALYGFFTHEGITTGTWLHAWIAGSGASYQWRASRGNGDLDVLLGVEARQFADLNPGFAAGSTRILADALNEQMKKYLWPLTDHSQIGGSVYEVTYYWNHTVSTDIRVIHPYAAWNLLTSQWDVHPDPALALHAFPAEWEEQAQADAARVIDVYREWSQALADYLLTPANGPAYGNAAVRVAQAAGELRYIWDLLHEGRRSAFTGNGKGWADWHNYRWQAAKASGTVDLLREAVREENTRKAATETTLYGAPIEPSEIALRRAALAYTRWNRT